MRNKLEPGRFYLHMIINDMGKYLLTVTGLIIIGVIGGCSKANRKDLLQAPPPAKYEMMEGVFLPMPGETEKVYTGEYSIMTATSSDIGDALEKLGVPRDKYMPLSNIYGVLNSKWFLGEFTDAYQAHLNDLNVKYTPELFVCGQYSTLACNFAMESAIRTGNALYPTLGWMVLNIGESGKYNLHAINVYYDGKKIIFYEPQPLKGFSFREITLSREKLATTMICVF